MVKSTLVFAAKSHPLRKYLRGKFVDSLRVFVAGGTGGHGLPKYGGIGGQGGCVYCVGKENATLTSITNEYADKRIIAGNGENSQKKRIIGSPGVDRLLEVPIGITIYTEGAKLAEINNEGDTCILARGGPGGSKINEFLGYEGQARNIVLDLKLIADVGFVGFPNAGKSTLLKALSRAKPKIANYPFTTIRPNLGIMEFPDLRSISLADLPGLIEGAHINFGMGHRFLRHVERTKLLMLIADVQGFSLSVNHKHRTCLETVMLLNKELELYNPDLLTKPAILVINKMDTPNADEKFEELKQKMKNIKEIQDISPEILPTQFLEYDDIVGISAINKGEDVTKLKTIIRDVLDIHEVVENEEGIESISEILVEKGPILT